MAFPERVRLAAAAALLALASSAHAMGDSQECRPEDLVPVDTWIAGHPWRDGPVNPNGLVASACRQSSGEQRLTIVAATYDLALDGHRDRAARDARLRRPGRHRVDRGP